MPNFFTQTLAAAALLLTSLSAPVHAQTTERLITVMGRGEVSVAPDMASVRIGVQTEADSAADALDQASAATAAILGQLDGQAIAPEDIQSGSIRLNPRYSSSVLGSQRSIAGYEAVNSVTVAVRDLGNLGNLLAALVGDGANRLDGVTFGLSDPEDAQDEARRRAVVESLRLADLYADAADVAVGAVVSISEAGSGGYSPMRAEPMMLEMAASAPQFDVPVAAGLIDLNASVTMVFEIAD